MRFQNDAERKVWSEAFDAGMSFSTGPHGAALFADLKVELMRSRSEDESDETDTGSDHPSLLGAVRECMRRLAALEEREDMHLVQVNVSHNNVEVITPMYSEEIGPSYLITAREASRLGLVPRETRFEFKPKVKP